ncbi:MAG: gliding motility-associated C-terminal domain-containing protein [Flavobacteriales bacterium]|nr:gliding motility-associated C-terminal domain-containing protein [Flavobacteriales bacterium]
MIRFLHNTFILCCIIAIATPNVVAQSNIDFTAQKSAEKIIDSYGGFNHAVINMTRDEWDVVRAWEGFDENAYLETLSNFKASFSDDREKRKANRQAKVLQSDCGCWVEPDATYTTLVPPPGLGGLQPGEEQWFSQGGAGWDVDCSSAPISFPGWTFELYGDTYEEFYVNSKGMISFGGDVIDWTPTGFPEAEYNQIAGYWQDTDNRSVGEIMYKVTQDAVYVNYVEVGYYNNHDDLTNSYQIIITPNDGIIGDGNNAQVCYLDMNWAHGDIGGGGGCCGDTPGVTGADQSATNAVGPHVQFGRFNLLDDTYNGPYGIGPGFDDGINWLDFKFFDINTAVSSTNLPPVPTENIGCDTITICLGQTIDIGVNFLGPEPGQSVTLDVTPNLIVGNDITGYIVTNGETASIAGIFNGNVPGLNSIDITATDDGTPSSSTSVTMVIEVLNVTLPELTIEGNLSICAGAETVITASGDFDSFSWNLSSQFTDGNVATIPFGGWIVVLGNLDIGCSVSETFFIDQTSYYLPDIETDPSPLVMCSDDTAYVYVPNPDDVYVGYTWEADWNGLGGQIYDIGPDDDEAWLAPGMYRLEVEDAGGCFGQRIFQVTGLDSDIPDMTIPPMCTGLDTVVFEGGFSSTDEGDLNLYLITSNNLGWEGSFINVYVNGEVVSTLTLINSTFGVFAVPIVFGDFIEIEYISANVNNDLFNQVQIFNCSNSENETVINSLSSGIIYSSDALCETQAALGLWEETSGPGTSWFENELQYNTLWAPTEYGMYELCFYEENCNIPYCYDVEVTLAPTITLNETEVFLCDGEDLDLFADTTDAGGAATINWPYPGMDNVLYNEYNYDEYTEAIIVVEIENGCGSDEAQVEVTSQFAPLIDSMFLCDEDDVITIDPIEGDENYELDYEWTWNGGAIDGADELVVNATGSYCVTVTNECFPNGDSDCGFVDIVSQIDGVFAAEAGGVVSDCDGLGIDPGEFVTIDLNLPSDQYTATWPDGSTGTTWTIAEDLQATDAQGNLLFDEEGNPIWAYNGSQICVDIEDPYGCGVTEHCVFLFIGQQPTINPDVNGVIAAQLDDIITMCPEIPYTFDLNAIQPGPPYSDISWSTVCNGEYIHFGNDEAETLTSWQFPEDCWGEVLTMQGTLANPCAPGGVIWEVDVEVDYCEITIPNVFTPRNADELNQKFEIDGLENYDGVLVRIFDRWGNLIYENFNYQNESAWFGDDAADGTYWYTLLLPNGFEHQGTVSIFR